MPLTDAKIRAAKPKAKPYKLSDALGLFLLINPQSPRYPNGSRLWRWRYTWKGRERLLALGAYPDRTLAGVRDLRDEHRSALRAGRDPGTERQAAKLGARIGTAHSFEAVARNWHASRTPIWTPGYAKEVIHTLEVFVFPEFGSMDIGAISTPMVLAILRNIEGRGTIDRAHRVRERLENIFAFAIASDLIETNPGLQVKGALTPNRHTKLPAVIDLPALIVMLRTAEAQYCQPATKAALRLIALTAARPGMIFGMLWDEIEDAHGNRPVWHLSAERMKMNREFFCPLSGPALDVLRAVKPLTGHGRFVFPNHRHINKPMSQNGIGHLLNRAGYHGVHCAHGFRASFTSIMNERHPADRDSIEAQLAHVVGGTKGAYLRAPFLERRAELLAEWGGLLMEGAKDAESLLLGLRRPPSSRFS